MLIVKILPDGNCLFSSISYGIRKDYKHSLTLRKCAVNYIKSNFKDFKNFIDESELQSYLSNMLKEGTYGDELILNAIPFIFDIKLNVYDKYTKKLISSYYNPSTNIKKEINLCYDNQFLHYDYIKSL